MMLVIVMLNMKEWVVAVEIETEEVGSSAKKSAAAEDENEQ